MQYTRQNPSERYLELIKLYTQLHIEGEKTLGMSPEQTFPGSSLRIHAVKIKELIDRTQADSILDYGSGKGFQYESAPVRTKAKVFATLQDYWDVEEVYCYDPSYESFNVLPEEKFDGVITTDVLEHCPEEDIEWIVDEIFSFAKKFVFAAVASYTAQKHLPNGENAHCTIQSDEWWQALFSKIAANYPDIIWDLRIQYKHQTESGEVLYTEKKVGIV